jgi:hypothetical protein
MEAIKSPRNSAEAPLFNGALETGVRALIILNAAYPISCDLTKLTWLDYLVVHTGDINGGPDSLHPNLPQRGGEILVRRRLIEEGLMMMRRLHLIATIPHESGMTYRATDEAYPLVELMKTGYSMKLKNRAKWLVENVCVYPDKSIQKLIESKLGAWNVEFQEKVVISRGSE